MPGEPINDAELRSLERICSKDDLSDSNVATLVLLGLKAASEVRRLRTKVADLEATLDDCCEKCLDGCPHGPVASEVM